jgi:hypothetical protein
MLHNEADNNSSLGSTNKSYHVWSWLVDVVVQSLFKQLKAGPDSFQHPVNIGVCHPYALYQHLQIQSCTNIIISKLELHEEGK